MIAIKLMADGNDEIYGGAGNDKIQGGLGADKLMAVKMIWRAILTRRRCGCKFSNWWRKAGMLLAIHLLVLKACTALIFTDILTGDAGNNILHGESGNDTLRGGAGNDVLFNTFGYGFSYGEAGDDELHGYDGRDVLDGGEGVDTLRYDRPDIKTRLNIDLEAGTALFRDYGKKTIKYYAILPEVNYNDFVSGRKTFDKLIL